MARKKSDLRDVSRIRISRAAVIAMCMSAMEAFPKETIGCVCSPSGGLSISSAFPYQLARRAKTSVSSWSSDYFERVLDGNGWMKLGDFHSHPFQYFEEVDPLEPSGDDIRSLRCGQMEVIIRAKMVRGKRFRWACKSKDGSVSVSLAKFRFLIRGFVRIPGPIVRGTPSYKIISLFL